MKERFLCWILGHDPSEQYSDGDYYNGPSPTFHCERCGEREPFECAWVGMRALAWLRWKVLKKQIFT